MDRLPIYYALSETVEGWTRGDEAKALARYTYALPDNAIVVEIGAFLGSGTILLAGARKLRRSGHVHSVDPFDASGDDFSRPVYDEILEGAPLPQVEQFRAHLARAGLARWAEPHVGKAEDVAADWSQRIDLLYMDGDQSPEGSRRSFDAWKGFLNSGAIVAIHNSYEREYAPTHDGHYRLRKALEQDSHYERLGQAGSINFFRYHGAAA